MNEYDLTLSFDLDDYGGRNYYFPYAFLAFDWFRNDVAIEESQRLGVSINPIDVSSKRNLDIASRPKFLCAFIGNPEPTRMRALNELSKIGQVDVFGASVAREVKSKFNVASEYKFMLAFENDLFPGYVTEKAPQAWSCGTIPLWNGLDYGHLFNSKALINLATHKNLTDFVSHVGAINSNSDSLNSMASMPLMSRPPNLDGLIAAIRSIF